MARRTQAGLRGGLWRSIRGAATKIRARAAAAATLGAWAKESECCVCVVCVDCGKTQGAFACPSRCLVPVPPKSSAS